MENKELELDLALANLRFSANQVDEAIVKQSDSLTEWDIQQLEDVREHLEIILDKIK